MSLELWVKWVEIIGKIIPILIGLFTLIKWGKPIWIFLKDLALLPSRAKKIEYELKPNSGQSLKDSINRIEIRQRLNEQRLLSVIDITGNFGAYETDENGACITTSLGYCHMVGRSQSENLGHGWIHNIYEQDKDAVFKEWNDAVKYMRVFDMNYKMVKDGVPFWVNSRAIPLHDENSKAIRWFGIIKKIEAPQQVDLSIKK